jgi:hypothetical protein
MKRLLLSALTICLLALPTLAQPGDRAANRGDHAWRAIEMQMMTTLTSGDTETTNTQLLNVIAMSTLYRTHLDFSRSVPAIIAIHKQSDDVLTRSRAVAALQAIDGVEARRYLTRHVSADEITLSRSALLEALHAVSSPQPLARN